MRRWLFALTAAAAVAVLTAGITRGAPKKGSQVTVRVLSAKVMAKPKFIGKAVATVSRGEHLTYQGKKSGWYQVTTSAGSGWIHKSAVVDKKVTLSSDLSSGQVNASEEEIELAGRGFTKEVEADYRNKNAALDFSHVDRIEALAMDPEVVGNFASEGKVGGDR